MRSNTLTPLLQFTEWFGINGFRANGINYPKKLNASNKCQCTLQHAWQSSEWTRDDLISMLQTAEDFFVREAGFHVAPVQISDELHKYKTNGRMLNANNEYKSVEPDYSCEIQEFGKYVLTFIGYMDVVKEIEGTIQDVFTGQVPLPAGTLIDNVKLYFTEADGNYAGELIYDEARELEIRPLSNCYIISNVLYMNEPAYLFKKPELDEASDCVDHVSSTYVDEVAVYILSVDKCDQGNFIYTSARPCSGSNCDESRTSICVQKRLVGGQTWAVPVPTNCAVNENDELVYTSYYMTGMPSNVELNYITGRKLKKGLIQNDYFSTVAKLAVGLADCIRNWCDCADCAKDKIEHYHSVLKVKTENADVTQRGVGDRYQIILTPQTLALIGGMPPYIGLTQGIQEILSYKCKTVEGSG